MWIVELIVFAITVFVVGGTLLSFVPSPHWLFRGWDFPRLQLFCIAAVGLIAYALFVGFTRWYDKALLIALGAVMAWHAYKILPYTAIWPNRVKWADREDPPNTLRLAISNVLQSNDRYERWLEVIESVDADVILAAEVDETWLSKIGRLEDRYPHCVRHPMDNMYGITLFSRLELIDPQVRFIVQDDIPSIHTGVRLPSGAVIQLRGLHPRPPEPKRDTPSTPRDAELVIVGREVKESGEPTVVAGDLNDVAWSPTTELFRKVSGLLDPRRGRGMYNTFDAESYWFRFPLDHVFLTDHFKLAQLERLGYVGSDHFPVMIELVFEPESKDDQQPPEPSEAEEREADEKIDREQQREEQEGDGRLDEGTAENAKARS